MIEVGGRLDDRLTLSSSAGKKGTGSTAAEGKSTHSKVQQGPKGELAATSAVAVFPARRLLLGMSKVVQVLCR